MRVFLNLPMTRRIVSAPPQFKPALLALLLTLTPMLSGCYAHTWAYSTSSGDSNYAVGEKHVVNFPAHQTFLMLQDVLRGDGVLFNVEPEKKVVTEWRHADTSVGAFADLMGANPRYRYEIQVLPLSAHQSTIVANLHAEDIPQSDIDGYKPSARLHLFTQFDKYAAQYPPAPMTPASGGVNFAVLPGEDLPHLAKRVTGDADNWHEIAKANSLTSPTDLSGVRSVWVPNSLLTKSGKQQQPSPSKGP